MDDLTRRAAKSYVRLVFRVILLIFHAGSLLATDPALSVSQYLHTSWTQEQGAGLPGVQTIAQTGDGYLWLGSSTGLIRFDGIRFVHWEPIGREKLPSSDIRLLVASKRGSLWIGSAKGISRLDGGHLTTYPAADGQFGGAVIGMLEDHLGRLWMLGQGFAGSSPGALWPDGSFHKYGPQDGLPAEGVQAMLEDRQHNFWVGTSKRLCRWSPGTPADCLNIPSVNVLSLVEAANGDLLIGDGITGNVLRLAVSRLVNGAIGPVINQKRLASVSPKVMLRDRDGNIWMGAVGQGLLRLGRGRADRFTRREGLSSDIVNALYEDREGDLWVGTPRGIDRFRDPKVAHLNSLHGLSSDLVTAVFAASHGGVWAGTYGGGLNRVTTNRTDAYSIEASLPGKTVLSLYEQAGGELWVATTAGLVHTRNGRFVPVRDMTGQPLDRVFAISGQNGALALADSERGLFLLKNGVARPLKISGLQSQGVYQLQFDTSGVLWIGYFQGGIAAVTGNSFRIYTTSDGLGSGPVRTIYQGAAGDLWVGTGGGLSRFHDGSWSTWTARQGLPEGGVRGIVEDVSRHALWLATADGLLRVSTIELEAALTSAKPLNPLLYGPDDGLRLAANGSMTNPTITQSDDGRIWLCTQDGLAIVDPARIRANPLPPPVAIEQMAVDGKPLDLTSAGAVRFRGRQVQITYTALSLVVPERIRFRYRLEGLDRGWTEAEGRRNVAYVDLPPSPYRFRVIACNNDGVWGSEGAALAFVVEPYYYQTLWFAALCLCTIGLGVWGAHRLRVRRVVSRVQLIAQERARLMRELHDSLLQGFAGVVYQLEAVARQFETAPDASKKRLERAIEQADRSLEEARRTMLSMRLPALENNTLPEALSAVATQLSKEASIAFNLEVKGRVQQLHYDQQANVYLIGREAVTNAVNHARASRIVATLAYSPKEIGLTVEDDGEGFDLEAGMAKADHWGIRGMRERAESIHAEFKLDTAPGRGTRIEIVVPRKQ